MKKRRLMAAESERLLEDLYENLDTESFLGHDFVGEDDPVGEPDSSSDESSDDENSKDECWKQGRDRGMCSARKGKYGYPWSCWTASFRETKYSKVCMKFWMKAIMKNFQNKFAYKVETKDKKFQLKYTTHRDAVHKLGKRGCKNVLKNAPGPRQAAKRVWTTLEAFSLFTSDEMLNDVVE